MDDPLSAVDTSVAEHIFDKCIVEYLSDKIRILVTHQIQFIRKATQILVLSPEGRCLGLGSYDELHSQGLDFMKLLSDQDREAQNTALAAEDKKSSHHLDRDAMMRSFSQSSIEAQKVRSFSKSSVSITDSIDTSSIDILEEDDEDGDGPRIQEEQREVGAIDSRVYWEYIKAGAGPLLGTSALLFTIISQTIFHGSDLWLTAWTDKNQAQGHAIDPYEQHLDVYIYSGLIGLLFFTTFIRAITWFVMCMRASVNLHNSIFYRLLRAPIAVFDSNPVGVYNNIYNFATLTILNATYQLCPGRILNRFTKDLGVVDEMLPATSFDLNMIIGQTIGVIVVVGLVNPYLVIPAVFIFCMVAVIRGIYIKSARDIKRFEGLTRSPVYSHVSTTISGLASVRAYGAQEAFERQFYVYQNDHSATWFTFLGTSRGLGWTIDWFCVLYIVMIAIVLMVFPDGIPGGSAGLAFSSALMLTGVTAWGVRQSAELESQLTSVERIIEYQRLPQEAPLDSDDRHRPPHDWPSKGRIEFRRMYLFYEGSTKPVLKNIGCTVKSGEKIGIVGRTGAGKSSIISALFRMVEPRGEVVVDGVDTKSIGLHDLRRNISIIPQDPVVFTGPVRRNLDPFGEYTDHSIWSALEEVRLRQAVQDLPGQLDGLLSEGGGNLSVGERQLVCLARAILRHNRLLVLDEATANVDHRTDARCRQHSTGRPLVRYLSCDTKLCKECITTGAVNAIPGQSDPSLLSTR
ncbi:unnamed protein product [Oppiella nova]|uniref:Uncharacterized protein n=1 Tax=Oppiella nova TaxID=334625 RepID=A0A7R9QGD3_9ACAR|nr:unnamed protein product [Oppiella nova]CAG2165318.1 unnamed protein product [Oppiella nova]